MISAERAVDRAEPKDPDSTNQDIQKKAKVDEALDVKENEKIVDQDQQKTEKEKDKNSIINSDKARLGRLTVRKIYSLIFLHKLGK